MSLHIKDLRKWIPGYEGLYRVSMKGPVISYHRKPVKGKEIGTTVSDGRMQIYLSKDGEGEAISRARCVLRAFGPDKPGESYDACHNDGDPHNDHIDNLRWDTRQNNIHDAVEHQSGHTAKFLPSQKDKICDLYDTGEYTQRQLANKFDCTQQAICHIVNNWH